MSYSVSLCLATIANFKSYTACESHIFLVISVICHHSLEFVIISKQCFIKCARALARTHACMCDDLWTPFEDNSVKVNALN